MYSAEHYYWLSKNEIKKRKYTNLIYGQLGSLGCLIGDIINKIIKENEIDRFINNLSVSLSSTSKSNIKRIIISYIEWKKELSKIKTEFLDDPELQRRWCVEFYIIKDIIDIINDDIYNHLHDIYLSK